MSTRKLNVVGLVSVMILTSLLFLPNVVTATKHDCYSSSKVLVLKRAADKDQSNKIKRLHFLTHAGTCGTLSSKFGTQGAKVVLEDVKVLLEAIQTQDNAAIVKAAERFHKPLP